MTPLDPGRPGPTRDNFHLSRPTTHTAHAAAEFSAIDCTGDLPEVVARYVRAGLANNTRRAYQSDLAHFIAWGGVIPATDLMLATYLAEHAGVLSVATLLRRLVAVSRAHESSGFSNPTHSALVRATISGIKRSLGTTQSQATPLLTEHLHQILAAMGDGIKDARDRALLLMGFAGGFRRSELVAIDRGDVEVVRQGIVIHIRRSKTDQVGAGRKIGIPRGGMAWCPVRALEEWISRSGIRTGPMFRRVNRHGHIYRQRLSGEAVSLVLKQRVAEAGLDPHRYSGHSLRAGFVTSAVKAGISTFRIRKQTGHRSDAMLSRYVRDGDLFSGNGWHR